MGTIHTAPTVGTSYSMRETATKPQYNPGGILDIWNSVVIMADSFARITSRNFSLPPLLLVALVCYYTLDIAITYSAPHWAALSHSTFLIRQPVPSKHPFTILETCATRSW